jgi:hypothetical protein
VRDDDEAAFEPMPKKHYAGTRVNSGKAKREQNTAQYTKRPAKAKHGTEHRHKRGKKGKP